MSSEPAEKADVAAWSFVVSRAPFGPAEITNAWFVPLFRFAAFKRYLLPHGSESMRATYGPRNAAFGNAFDVLTAVKLPLIHDSSVVVATVVLSDHETVSLGLLPGPLKTVFVPSLTVPG